MVRVANKKNVIQAVKQVISNKTCAGGFHEDVCCPEPYRYKYKYICKAVPRDFRICREKTDCPCCPAPYEYEYTVHVTCVPGKCEPDNDVCPIEPPSKPSCAVCPSKSVSTDSFPTKFSEESCSTSKVRRRHRRL